MEYEKRRDLILAGSGTAAGGRYNRVELSGSCKVAGDIECERLRVAGSATIDGRVKSAVLTVSGSSRFEGSLEAGELEVKGKAHIAEHATAKRLLISGLVHVGKQVSGEEIEVSGSLTVEENCAAETFKAKGSFRIGGLLNADLVDITLYHHSEAEEIGGEVIRVRRGKAFSFGKWLGAAYRHRLRAETIEGDEVMLEDTRAKMVRGNDVKIGPGCEIDRVEYNGTIEIDADAVVREHKKI